MVLYQFTPRVRTSLVEMFSTLGCGRSISALLASTDVFPLLAARPPLPISTNAFGVLMQEEDGAASCKGQRVLQLLPTTGRCECAYDVRPAAEGRLTAPAPASHGPSSGGQRHFHLSAERTLLRIVAAETAVPGLNWALGLDALRVLEADRGPDTVDWLVSIDADDEDDIRERIECGVQGESFRRYRQTSPLAIQRLLTDADAFSRPALALPECCRVAAATEGALPAGAEILWRVTPSSGVFPTPLERNIGGGLIAHPYLVTARTAKDILMLARTLPRGSVWGAHLTQRGPEAAALSSGFVLGLPSAEEVAMLRAAGCGGLALGGLTWQPQPKGAAAAQGPGSKEIRSGRTAGAHAIADWAARVNVDLKAP